MASTKRSYNVTWILSFVLGHLGVDRFYLGYIWQGVVKLLTGGGFGIWYLIDLIIILTGRMKDREGQELEGYQQYKYLSWLVVAGLLLFSFFIGLVGFWISLFTGFMHGQLNLHMGHWL